MRETAPSIAVDGSIVIARPPCESIAPMCVSGCPPVPLISRDPNTLSELICPMRSIDSALFSEWKLSFCEMFRTSST